MRKFSAAQIDPDMPILARGPEEHQIARLQRSFRNVFAQGLLFRNSFWEDDAEGIFEDFRNECRLVNAAPGIAAMLMGGAAPFLLEHAQDVLNGFRCL